MSNVNNHLIIGLGGTGGSVIRALRKRIFEEYHTKDPFGKALLNTDPNKNKNLCHANIEYLYVDSSLTDLHNEEQWMTLGTSVQLDPAQRLSINGIGAGVLQSLASYPGMESFINRSDQEMLQDGIGPIINEGIGGQRRRFGRMLMANNMMGRTEDTFLGRVEQRVRLLTNRVERGEVTFHICAGLGGGTGSGSIVDALAQIRTKYPYNADGAVRYKVQLYLYVPEEICQIPGGDDANPFYQPNGYAALSELNAISVGKYFPTDIKGVEDENGKVRRLLKDSEAFEIAYLYTNMNELGRQVDIHKVLPNIIGDFLFQKIVVGSAGSGKMVRLESAENGGLLPEQDAAGEYVHSRRFMTIGVKRVEYPGTEVEEYGGSLYAKQMALQMLYGVWDESRGFLDECTDDMVGKSLVASVPTDNKANLLSEDYLMLSKPLPSLEGTVRWRPIQGSWDTYVEVKKKETLNEASNRSQRIGLFNSKMTLFFETGWRQKGVSEFYRMYEDSINGFAEEIVRKIENNLFTKWKNGPVDSKDDTTSILAINKYLKILIAECDKNITQYSRTAKNLQNLREEKIALELKRLKEEYTNPGCFDRALNCFAHNLDDLFNRYCTKKGEELEAANREIALGYSVKLLTEVRTMLQLLQKNVVEPLKDRLADFADVMKTQANSKCNDDKEDTGGEVTKEYDPKLVRDTIAGFLKKEAEQKTTAAAVRGAIIALADSENPTFTGVLKNATVAKLINVVMRECITAVRTDLRNFTIKNPTIKMVDVNILERLGSTVCSTDEKLADYVSKLYNEAQSFLTFSQTEEGQGSAETAALHKKIIQIALPEYFEDGNEESFRTRFIRKFANSGTIEFNENQDVSLNPKSNQIVIVTAHSGFPLRYINNTRTLKQRYDMMARKDVNRMVLHTESFAQPLPELYNVGASSKELIPIAILAYSMNLIVEKEDIETGEKYNAFAGPKNAMGRVSKWIRVGRNILDTVEELQKLSRTADARQLAALVRKEMEENYKHIEKRKELMLKMGEVLETVVLPLCNGNENNPTFVSFNKEANKLCDNDLKI